MRKILIFFLLLIISGYITHESSGYAIQQIICFHDSVQCPNGSYTISYNILNGTITTVNLAGCTDGQIQIWQASNHTWICSTNTVGLNTAQIRNVGTANGLGIWVTRDNTTQNSLRSITCGNGLACSTNATNFRINSTALTAAILTINSDPASAQVFSGTSNNVTIADTGSGTLQWNLGGGVLMAGLNPQTVTKSLTLNAGILGGDLNVGSNALTNSGHKGTLSSTNSGTFLYSNGTLSSLTGNLNTVGGTFTGTLSGGSLSGSISGTPTLTGSSVTINSLALGGDANIGSNALTNAGHKITLPLNTGTLLPSNGTFTGTLSGGVLSGTITGTPTLSGNPVTISNLAATLASQLHLNGQTAETGGHVSTFPSNTGTLLQSNGTLTGTLSGGTLSGTISGTPTLSGNPVTINNLVATLAGNLVMGNNLFSTNGHVITPPQNTGTIALLNSSLSSMTGNLNTIGGTFTGTCSSCAFSGTETGTATFGGNYTMKFGAGGIIERNPASTFATKIEGNAVLANRTVNLPLASGTLSDIVGSILQKSETGADTTLLTYTPPSATGVYQVNIDLCVSAASSATLGWTMTWTDSNGHANAPTNMEMLTMGSATSSTTVSAAANTCYYGVVPIDINNAGTNIVVKTTFSGTSIAYKASANVVQLQ